LLQSLSISCAAACEGVSAMVFSLPCSWSSHVDWNLTGVGRNLAEGRRTVRQVVMMVGEMREKLGFVVVGSLLGVRIS